MSRKNRKKSYNRGAGVGFEQALKSDPALSAFTFDGPYSVSGFDLLDNMYCADNGAGTKRRLISAGWRAHRGRPHGISLRCTSNAMRSMAVLFRIAC